MGLNDASVTGAAWWTVVPDWLAAGGTLGAVFLALWFGLRDGKRLDAELKASAQDRAAAAQDREEEAEERRQFRRERAEAAKERRRELADQVSFRVEKDYVNAPGLRGFLVLNHGPHPIASVRLFFGPATDGVEPLATWWTVPPKDQVFHNVEDLDINDALSQMTISFRDSRGCHWTKDLDGNLTEHHGISREG